MKKIISLAMAAILAMSLFGCAGQTAAEPTATTAAAETAVTETAATVAQSASNDNWKVAVLTGTV